ncbi:hypothetical protein B0H13DRAFT_1890105 [Mycena leptocephala]|nr:hypothetical protein B0H13DRAFT_1919722 [Mycena leptocephala]KAJ7884251.1 hypothetical protein B0H13DRAFT_1890105 [Mycena leptocephala]
MSPHATEIFSKILSSCASVIPVNNSPWLGSTIEPPLKCFWRMVMIRDGHGYGLGYEAVNPDPYPENLNPNPRSYGSITVNLHYVPGTRGQPAGFGSGKLPTRDPYPPDPTREPDGFTRTRVHP